MSIMHRRTAERGSHDRRRYPIASAPMTTVSLTKTALSDVKADAIVIGVAKGASGLELAPGAAEVDKAFKKRLLPALKALGAKGSAGEVTKLASLGAVTAPAVVAVGLGPAPAKGERFDPETLRRGRGAAMRSLAGSTRVATALANVNGEPGEPELRAVAEGAHLGAYSFSRYRTAASAESARRPVQSTVLVVANPRDKEVKGAIERAAVIAESVQLCRDLVNTAPGDLRPADFAQAAVDACRPLGLDVEVLDDKALKKGGYGGVPGVGARPAPPPPPGAG